MAGANRLRGFLDYRRIPERVDGGSDLCMSPTDSFAD
jgi:hypothetical protein